jgi:hypothetical protein
MKKSIKFSRSSYVFIIALLVIMIFSAVLIIRRQKSTNKSTTISSDAKTTSTAATAQPGFTGGGDRDVNRPVKDEGTVNDTRGVTDTPVDQSRVIVSVDSKISLFSPSTNDLVRSGDQIIGESSLPKVYFRLIDDVSGVIAQGSLIVVNGRFSGNFSFTTTGNNGRLDIFSISGDGIESSNIEVPIKLK